MEYDIDYFRAVQGTKGIEDSSIARLEESRRNLREGLKTSINYYPDVVCNGHAQEFVITSSDVPYKADVEAFPGDELHVGDELEFINKSTGNLEHWIVVKCSMSNPLQVLGLAWLCNWKFRWQNFSSTIIERWGVLDSGVYSTTVSSDFSLPSTDVQYKVYLPLDSDTEKIYIDKRLAIGKSFDSHGRRVLKTYKVTNNDSVSSSYGTGGHLLCLNVRSASDFTESVDSYEQEVCDYIAPESVVQEGSSELLNCSITGASSIRVGTSRNYTAKFYDADGTTEVSGLTPVFNVSPAVNGITYSVVGNVLSLNVVKDDSLIGQEIVISLVALNGAYREFCKEVEVRSVV